MCRFFPHFHTTVKKSRKIILGILFRRSVSTRFACMCIINAHVSWQFSTNGYYFRLASRYLWFHEFSLGEFTLNRCKITQIWKIPRRNWKLLLFRLPPRKFISNRDDERRSDPYDVSVFDDSFQIWPGKHEGNDRLRWWLALSCLTKRLFRQTGLIDVYRVSGLRRVDESRAERFRTLRLTIVKSNINVTIVPFIHPLRHTIIVKLNIDNSSV